MDNRLKQIIQPVTNPFIPSVKFMKFMIAEEINTRAIIKRISTNYCLNNNFQLIENLKLLQLL